MSDDAEDVPVAQDVGLVANPGLPANPSGFKFKGKTCSVHTSAEYVSLEQLEVLGPLPRSTIRSVLVCMVLYLKKVAVDGRKGLFNRTSQAKTDAPNYDRTMCVMCLNSPAGRNSAIILLNNHRANSIFSQYIMGRDSADGFGPGAIIVISRPNPIDNYFGEDALHGIPVLNFSGGFKLVDKMAEPKISLGVVPFKDTANRLHGFFYPRVKIYLMNCNVGHTTCCGHLCDSIGLKKTDGSGNWHRACPCYALKRALGQVVLDVNLRVVVVDEEGNPTGKEFYTSDFTSRRFTEMFTVAGFPSSVNAAMLEEKGVDVDIFFRVEQILTHVNDKLNGFCVLGWARRGLNRDPAAVAEAAGRNGAEPSRVIASGCNHHVTYIGMNDDAGKIESMLINVSRLLQED